jgi:drug/metabolite transporter (DMT)-like permease
MKIILSEVSVWWFRALCLMFGGSFLMLISALSGNRCRLYPGEIGPVLLCGSFAILGWMVFSAYGVSLMPAGRASIIAFTMPLWATMAAAWVLGERITAGKIAGLMLGLAGLGVLIGPDLLILKRAPVGALFMLLAAISWGLGTVMLKRIAWRIPTLSNVAWQLLLSAVPVTLIAVLNRTQWPRRHRTGLPVPVPDELLPVGLFQDGRAIACLDRRHRHVDGAGNRRIFELPDTR